VRCNDLTQLFERSGGAATTTELLHMGINDDYDALEATIDALKCRTGCHYLIIFEYFGLKNGSHGTVISLKVKTCYLTIRFREEYWNGVLFQKLKGREHVSYVFKRLEPMREKYVRIPFHLK